MNAFDRLSKTKRPCSSASIKALAQNILNGQTGILLDCIDFVSNEISAQQHVRAGVSKVIEIVAMNRPDLVAPYLHKLLPALSADEPRACRMIMRTMGFCAHLNRPVARDAILYAERYIDHKKDLPLASATNLFLGDVGALSKEDAQAVFPLLERSMHNMLSGEQDWLLEAVFKMLQNLDQPERGRCFAFAECWQDSFRKKTRQRVSRILRLRDAPPAA